MAETVKPFKGHYHILYTEMYRSYLEYAMSVIVGRALPDVRVMGLKTRSLTHFSAMSSWASDRSPVPKVRGGDVLGKYHPTVIKAVYDALVRLVRIFSRYPFTAGMATLVQ